MSVTPERELLMSTEIVPGLVSVVIPCYKGERWLGEAIESCLAQTYSPREVIVVDDVSPDSCAAIADRYAQVDPRVRVVRRPQNGGVSRAFNSGFEIARGEFFTRLAQDDLFEPDAISRMVATLKATGPRTGLVYCDYRLIDEAGSSLGNVTTPGPETVLRYRNEIGLCVMWTRQAWETAGRFDPQFDSAEDFEYWLRVRERFDIRKCDGPPALRFRQHSSMGTRQFSDKQDIAFCEAVIANARHGRFRFDRRWAERQIGMARAFQTLGHIFLDRQAYGRALGCALRSLFAWPPPFPASARDGKSAWARQRMVGGISVRLIRILLQKFGKLFARRMSPELKSFPRPDE